jgi:4-hydroxybenzoate polyprenyltransferase
LVTILILAGLVVTSQLFFIRTPVLIGGLVLSWVIVIYFLTLKRLKYLKELAGAILYTGGVLVAPLSLYHDSLTAPQTILIGQFLMTALINLLIFSWFDMEKDIQDRRESFATYYGVDLTYKVFMFLVLLNTVVGIYIVLQNDRYLWMEVCLLMMNIILAALAFEKKYFNTYDRYRVLGDAIFFIPLVYLLFR